MSQPENEYIRLVDKFDKSKGLYPVVDGSIYLPFKDKLIPSTGNLPFSYEIFKDEYGIVYAKNGRTGKIDFFGNDASTVIQKALDSLTPNRTWKERVVVRGDFTLKSPLTIRSYTLLELLGRLKLADRANCYMLKTDFSTHSTEIEVCGGIWDGNGANQTRSISSPSKLTDYFGHIFFFYDVDHLRVHDLKTVNPNAWAIRIQKATQVDVGNIMFDHNGATPNEDGCDICGPASDISIHDLIGNTTDDIIGIFNDAGSNWNAGVAGEISYVNIKNVINNNPNYYGGICFYAGSTTYYTHDVNISNVIIRSKGYIIHQEAGKTYNVVIKNVTGYSSASEANIAAFRWASGVAYRWVIDGVSIIVDHLANLFYFGITPEDSIIRNFRAYATVDAKVVRSENSGKATFSGDGTTKTFTIPHGLYKSPSEVSVTPASSGASGSFYVTVDGTNIYVNYLTAPPAGTNNVVLYWEAKT